MLAEDPRDTLEETPPEVRSERGRQRREAILEAATAEFLEKGYQAASLRTIVAGAGGSTRTLYQLFGDKAGLFRAVAARRREGLAQPFPAELAGDRPMADELFEMGLAYLRTFLGPEPLAFFRMMVAESAARPELARMVWQSGPEPFAVSLAGYLTTRSAREGFAFADPQLAAWQFLEMTKAALHVRVLLTGEAPPEDEMARRVRSAVDIFLNGARGAAK